MSDHCTCEVCDRIADAIYDGAEKHFELIDGWECACGYQPPTEYAGSLKGQMLWQHIVYEHFKAASAAYHTNL